MQTPQQILQQYWGYNSFRGRQQEIIEAVLKQKDVLALLPTGGGKSVCFQVPALALNGVCLVVSPLIALMKDQVENLLQKKIPAIAIHSGMQFAEVKNCLQLASQGEYKFIYLSPERLESNLFKLFLPSLDISLIAVDEAHCISMWGYDFRPPYLKIASLKEQLTNVPVIALTASATPKVQTDIISKLKLNNAVIFKQSFARLNLSYSVFKIDSKINKLHTILQAVQGSSVVYCKSRKQVKRIAIHLQQLGISASYYHAGLTAQERMQKQQDWINNTIRVIVCTNAFGMGIDKPDVRSVIHYDVPESLENYYQEAGRAGRDGKRAFAVLLYQNIDERELKELPDIKYPSVSDIKKIYHNLANFLQIPAGIGEGNYYDFDLASFCKNFNYDIFLVMNALKALEQDGHLSFNETVFIASTVKFTADKYLLEEFEKTNPEDDAFIKCLLRTYAGIYDDVVPISEKLISKLLKQSVEKTFEGLQKLHSKKIIFYQPQKETPQIYYRFNRATAQHINFNTTTYFERKANFINQVDVMLNYLSLQNKCRSQFIGKHFGDETIEVCGVCDNCLAQKSNAIDEEEFNNIKQNMYNNLQQEVMIADTLLKNMQPIKKEKFWKVLTFLQDQGLIIMDDQGILRIKK